MTTGDPSKIVGGNDRYKIDYMTVAVKSRCVPEVVRTTLNIDTLHGRGGGIRTPDPLLPKQMRYQTALRPDDAPIVSRRDSYDVARVDVFAAADG